MQFTVRSPFNDRDGQVPDEIEVTDPFHPLFGRRFRVHSVDDSNASTARVFVVYRDDIRLLILRRSTNLSLLEPVGPRSKLSADAVSEFLALVREYELCPPRPGKSGSASPRRSNKRSSRN